MILLSSALTAFYLAATNAENEVIRLVVILSFYMYGLTVARTLMAPAFSRQAMIGPAIAEFLCNALPIATSILLVEVYHAGISHALQKPLKAETLQSAIQKVMAQKP